MGLDSRLSESLIKRHKASRCRNNGSISLKTIIATPDIFMKLDHFGVINNESIRGLVYKNLNFKMFLSYSEIYK